MDSDGSIVVDVELDYSAANKELAKLKKEIKSTEEKISKTESERSPIVEKLKAANDEAVEARKNVERLENALEEMEKRASPYSSQVSPEQIMEDYENKPKIKEELEKQKKILEEKEATVRKITAQDEKIAQTLEQQKNLLNSQVERAGTLAGQIAAQETASRNQSQGLSNQAESAGELSNQMEEASDASDNMKDSIKEADNFMDKLANRIKKLASRVFVFSMITMLLRGMRTWLGKVVKSNDEASGAIARLKGALLTLAQPLVNVIIPAFTFLVNLLSQIVTMAAKAVSTLFGTTYEDSQKAAKGLYEETEAIDGVGKAAKKAQKSLASFDEINQIGDEEQGGGGTSTIAPDFSGTDDGWLSGVLGEAAGWVTAALMIGGIALVAIGAMTGSLSLVLAGLLMLGTGITVGTETGTFQSWADTLGLSSAEEFVTAALLLGGIALIALGAATMHIMAVIAGLGLLGAGIAYGNESGVTASWIEALGLESIFDYVVAGMQLAGIAMVAIGAMMTNIFLIIAGAVILGLGVAAENIGEETLTSWWEKLQLTTVMQWVAVTFLLIGIALVAIGAAFGNIIMVVAGAALIGAGTVAASTQEGNLKDWVKVLGLEKVAGFVTAGLLLVGLALVVFGIFSQNIVMILAGASLLGAGIAVGVTTGTFSNWLDTILDAFTKFKDAILGVFTALWDGVKFKINGIITFIETLANGVIYGINKVINALNSLSFDVPDWVPGIGGETWGFNLRPLEMVHIPRLASGAVIPPNREFAAILGDQKQGTNIEAPASLIKQMVLEAMRETGGSGGRDITVIMELDRREFGRVVYRANNEETQRVGVRLAGARA